MGENDQVKQEGEETGGNINEVDEHGEKIEKSKKVDPSQRITTRYMTKYEKARILGTRALQLR